MAIVHGSTLVATDSAATLNLIANLVIVAGYVLVPFTVLRYLPLSWNVQISGTFFFTTCAITHLAMAFRFEHHWSMVANHVIQAVSVVWFVLGFWHLLREATRRNEERQ